MFIKLFISFRIPLFIGNGSLRRFFFFYCIEVWSFIIAFLTLFYTETVWKFVSSLLNLDFFFRIRVVLNLIWLVKCSLIWFGDFFSLTFYIIRLYGSLYLKEIIDRSIVHYYKLKPISLNIAQFINALN